jgi:MFS family permease
VGGFFAAYSGAALVVRLLFGWAPDRFGPKRLLSPSLLVLAAGFVWLALARDAAHVALAGLLCGVGHGFAFPILFALVIARAGDAERGSAMAVFTSLFDLGILLGGPLFGGISEWLGYPALYGTAAGVLLLGVGVFLLWDRRR